MKLPLAASQQHVRGVPGQHGRGLPAGGQLRHPPVSALRRGPGDGGGVSGESYIPRRLEYLESHITRRAKAF